MKCPKCKKEAPESAAYCPWCGRLLGAIHRSKTRRGNDQGTAYKRGRTWTAQWTVDTYSDDEGHFHQVRKTKGGFKTKKEAQDYCITRSLVPEKEAPKLIHYWDQYKENGLKKLVKDTQTAYKIAWKRWEDLWYHQIDRITSAEMQSTVDAKTSSYYPAHDMRSLMVNLFKIAAAEGVVNKDLPSFITLPELEETEQTPFTQLEQVALWKAWEKGCIQVAAPLTMIYTGMMPGELINLKAENIDLASGTITRAGMKTKVRKKAVVYLPDAIIPVLETMISLIGQGRRTQPFWKSEQKFYREYYEGLAIAKVRKLTPYSCRHTTATALAIDKNIAPQTIQKIMRWSTTRMLDRYAHPDDQSLRLAVNTIGKQPTNSLQQDSEAL